MQTLAQILAGAGGNPYQQASPGGGISPLVQQLLLANQMGGPQIGEANTNMMQGAGQGQQAPLPGQQGVPPGQPTLPAGLGSMGALASMVPGTY